MKILLAKEIGYCYGVRDAVRDVVRSVQEEGKDVRTLGPLMHNPVAVRDLQEQYNVSSVQEISEFDGQVLAIRAHGVDPKALTPFMERGIEILDATCPFVKKTHKLARKLLEEEYFVVILGKKKHPEVIGIAGHVEGNCLVIQTKEDLQNLRRKKKIGMVFQSTVTLEDFSDLIIEIAKRTRELKIYPTICDVTTRRQTEAQDMARKVDRMIVVGGENSSNTLKLVDLCKKEGTETVQIQTAEQLSSLSFEAIDSVGLITGTSTPQLVVDEIVSALESHSKELESKLESSQAVS